jgi:hypothetical protein
VHPAPEDGRLHEPDHPSELLACAEHSRSCIRDGGPHPGADRGLSLKRPAQLALWSTPATSPSQPRRSIEIKSVSAVSTPSVPDGPSRRSSRTAPSAPRLRADWVIRRSPRPSRRDALTSSSPTPLDRLSRDQDIAALSSLLGAAGASPSWSACSRAAARLRDDQGPSRRLQVGRPASAAPGLEICKPSSGRVERKHRYHPHQPHSPQGPLRSRVQRRRSEVSDPPDSGRGG